jgi:hypothetical protein
MCISKLSEYVCGHVETTYLNSHCTCVLLIGTYESADHLCPSNCGTPVSPMAFRSLLGIVGDRNQVLGM